MSLTEQQQLLQKGGDARHEAGGYYSPTAARPESAASSSPPTSGSVVVPQPINVSKMGSMQSAAAAHGLGHPLHPQHGQHPQAAMRKYQCKMCPQIFASKADLQLHTQIHMREPKPYKCASCNKAFANSSYLSQHTRIHLGIKPYRCEICQRKFTQLSHLQQHIRTHTGDKPYKCRVPGCTKAFSQLSNLQSHSRCHQSDKPYKCNSCYKCFTDEPALLEHIPKHRDSKHVKTHICAYCGKSYTQETYLAKHMQKHADRVDKRAPINAGPGHSMPGLSDPYWPGKMDPLAAMYGYHHQPLADHRLGELDPREQGYSGAGWDPRTSSAFSPLQPPQAPLAHKTSAAHGFDLKGFEQKAASNFDQKAPGFDLKGFDQKGGQVFEPSAHFGAKASTQSAVQQDMKGGFISLASIRNYSSDKPGLAGEKQQ